jgi:hypothetical protein
LPNFEDRSGCCKEEVVEGLEGLFPEEVVRSVEDVKEWVGGADDLAGGPDIDGLTSQDVSALHSQYRASIDWDRVLNSVRVAGLP